MRREIEVDFTPWELASEVSSLSSLDLARFFNGLGLRAGDWKHPFYERLRGLKELNALTDHGIDMMLAIIEVGQVMDARRLDNRGCGEDTHDLY